MQIPTINALIEKHVFDSSESQQHLSTPNYAGDVNYLPLKNAEVEASKVKRPFLLLLIRPQV